MSFRRDNRNLYCPYCWDPLTLDGACGGGYDGNCGAFPSQYMWDAAVQVRARIYRHATPRLGFARAHYVLFKQYNRPRQARLRIRHGPLRMDDDSRNL